MAERDDRDWIEALAGRPPVGADPALVKEAEALRRAIDEHRSREPAPEFDTEAGLARLRFRLRREGLDGSRSLFRYAALALAASFVLTAGVLLLVPRPEKEEPAFRGIERPQTLLADDPARAAESLARDLEALGLAPRVTRQEDATLVESPWPKELEDRHRALLARHYLRPPEGTRLAVEVRKRP